MTSISIELMTDKSQRKFLAVLKICSHLCIQNTCHCFAFLNQINTVKLVYNEPVGVAKSVRYNRDSL
jgi:hypothetical protein